MSSVNQGKEKIQQEGTTLVKAPLIDSRGKVLHKRRSWGSPAFLNICQSGLIDENACKYVRAQIRKRQDARQAYERP